MINSEDTNIYAAFMMEGLHNVGYDEAIKAWDNGCLELVQIMCEYAKHADTLVEAAIKAHADLDFAGVFDYEVCTPFGEWFGKYVIEHEGVPETKEGLMMLTKLATEFFIQGAGHEPEYTLRVSATLTEVFDVFSPP